MPDTNPHDAARRHPPAEHNVDLIPREFLRIIAVWSLIPAYLGAGGFIGWVVDRWLNSWPFGFGIGLLIALGLAIRDMLRLKDEL